MYLLPESIGEKLKKMIEDFKDELYNQSEYHHQCNAKSQELKKCSL